MTKQSANRHNKQHQGNSKPANKETPSLPQTAKANGTVATKPVEATEKANGTMPSKPAQTATKSGSAITTKPGQSGVNAGSLKRAQHRRQEKTQNRLEQQRADARSTRITIFTIATVVILVGSLITYLVIRNVQANDPLAQAQTVVDPTYQPIDGVYCDANEQLSYHIHAYLQIYIDGANVPLSQGIGIAPGTAPSCLYWLHTHDTSGVIHIESPTTRIYTLKQFFDIWQSFTSSTITYPTQLSSSTGWIIYVNGKQVNTDFSHLQLNAHDIITLANNSPGIKPVTTYAWQGL
jgi:hypothetical protein